MTLVKNHNMNNIEQYAKLIEKANPAFIEAKAYMHIGFSNLRLEFDDMPQLAEVKTFAETLSEKTGYSIIDESADSRVVLLSRRDINNKNIKEE
jgi:tRNA wybutosine-synthesizing protein 1